jgi:hypothetical protein
MAKRKNKEVQKIDPATLDTYFKKRMYEIGITDTAAHCFKVEVEYPGSSFNQPIFAETPAGDIQINYPCLYGGFEPIGNTETAFTRLRYKPENQPGADHKYFQDKGSGVHIFFPPAILQKFNKKTPINTLILVEGEFKAYAGALHGLDIIGLGGKDLFTDGEKRLHTDILAIIRKCDVENLVLLLDADVKAVTWDAEMEPEKDLGKRLKSFYKTVERFREMAKTEVKDAYFAHIKEHYLPAAKGLDDMLHQFVTEDKGEEKKVCEDLMKLTAARHYFTTINVSTTTPYSISISFDLNYKKRVPAQFYYNHEALIKDRKFIFLGARYQKLQGEELTMLEHEESHEYIRVGCDYLRKIEIPDAKKIFRPKLDSWKWSIIMQDYIKNGCPNFADGIKKYKAFCNVPCNNTGYEQVIGDCYNLYFPITHKPEPGTWPNIEKYFKHVFGEMVLPSGHTNYELALDYFTLLWAHPTQRLPILCLVSKEHNTGKSTLLFFANELLQDNFTFIGNEELKDHLNDDWASKLVIGIDEGFIDKRTTMNRIKTMNTNHTIKLRAMYSGRQPISFFGKFMLTANDEETFAPIEGDDTRFWVNKVPVLKSDDPHILDKMITEIPAFIHMLEKRQILHPEAGRLWFKEDLIDTAAGKKVKENSKGWLYSDLRVLLEGKFLHYRWPTLYYSSEELAILMNGPTGSVKYRIHDIQKTVANKFK